MGHTSMKPEEINEYRKQRAKAEKSLDMYVQIAEVTREDLEVPFPASLLL